MIKIDNIKQTKSTILGVLIFLVGLAYILLIEQASFIIFLTAELLGILLILSPNKILFLLFKFLRNNTDKKI